MLILISPAKTLDLETPARVKNCSVPDFLDQSELLIDRLRKYRKGRLSKLMNISDTLAELNVSRYHEWHTPFSPENARPAIQAFRGDVYLGLDADSMSKRDLQHAQKHLRILSGLYGILRPLDLMQAYRLEMGTSLKTRRGSSLYEFWGDRLTNSLNAELADRKQSLVVNLASNEYFKSVNKRKLDSTLISPVFKDEKNGNYKVISFFAKKARGAMARYLLDERSQSAEDITGFNRLGYRYYKAESSADQPVFRRTEKAALAFGPNGG